MTDEEHRLLEDWLLNRRVVLNGVGYIFPQGRHEFLRLLERARDRKSAPVLEAETVLNPPPKPKRRKTRAKGEERNA